MQQKVQVELQRNAHQTAHCSVQLPAATHTKTHTHFWVDADKGLGGRNWRKNEHVADLSLLRDYSCEFAQEFFRTLSLLLCLLRTSLLSLSFVSVRVSVSDFQFLRPLLDISEGPFQNSHFACVMQSVQVRQQTPLDVCDCYDPVFVAAMGDSIPHRSSYSLTRVLLQSCAWTLELRLTLLSKR